MRKIKIGIDVGGTFTHAVGIDIADFNIIGKSCVPTTHTAKEGVAKGIIDSLQELIEDTGILPEEISLIAHSTTQATNALLEGDVACVGILGLGDKYSKFSVNRHTKLKNIELAPDKYLHTKHAFLNTSEEITEHKVKHIVEQLKDEGAEVFVVSEIFGVDDTTNENKVGEIIRNMKFMVTEASTISQLYGLKVRTRTAVINASMMPKMLETANMTEQAVKNLGIRAPLMVMRSDGGIIDINEVRRRPILTMLSGPAAGVSAALMYAKISDGVFIEVGGTSSDISVIKNGKPQIKSAQIGGNKLFLQTLDIRTVGIGGGSMVRYEKDKIIDVGPRSAHIANLHYLAFTSGNEIDDIEFSQIQPKKQDPADYMKICSRQGDFTLTPTEASCYLKGGKFTGHDSVVNTTLIEKVLKKTETIIGKTSKEIAENICTISAKKIEPVINQLIREYKLDKHLLKFIGGGGGASAIVPFAAQLMETNFSIAKNSEVISAIGVALGMIRDSVERNIVNPSNDDILKLRKEVFESVVSMGAVPATIEVFIEIDTQNKKVIATAMGTNEMKTKDMTAKEKNDDEIREIAATSLKTEIEEVDISGKTSSNIVATHTSKRKYLFGLFSETITNARVISKDGTIKLQINDCNVKNSDVGGLKNTITQLIDELTSFGDAGGLIPDIFVLASGKTLDLTGLVEPNQILAMVDIELKDMPEDEKAVIIASKNA